MKALGTAAFKHDQSAPTSNIYSALMNGLYQGRQPIVPSRISLKPKLMVHWLHAWRTSWFCLLLTTLLANPTGQAWGQIISTVAGNGTTGFSGDNGPATSANLNFSTGVAVDASGNLYFAEPGYHRVRKVNAKTGIISTIAGNGNFGFSGDGGAATSASLNVPSGVAVDTSGNLYIADTNNNRIRKVSASTGIISTVAGNGDVGFSGDGGGARFTSLNAPAGVAVDGFGNIYINDQGNGRIRKVSASSGKVSTVAGNGNFGFSGDGGAATSATLYNPAGVTLDAFGNLYITDTNNNRIRKVTVSTGIISTVAGNGSYSFGGDEGAAILASLRFPFGATVDASGNLYIADTANNRIRKVNASTGIISTIAGNGNVDFSGDGGAATSASLKYPNGVTLDASGNLYIADSGNNRIRKVSSNTAPTVVTTIPSQTATVGQAFSYTLPTNTFTDDQTPSALILSFTGLPAGLSFTAPATISGTPTTATGSPFSLTVTATDPGGLSVSTTLTLTVQPEIIGGADLTPILYMPQGNFAASGPESIHNLTMSLSEQVGKATSGVMVLTLTAPLGYSLGFDPTLVSTNVTGGTANPVTVNNAAWEVQSSTLLQLTLVSKTNQRIGAGGVSVIGLTLSRVNASSGSANLTVNVNDDPANGYDSNPANNIFVRILNAL